ncbi:MAG: hydrogenase formation protein HypD [Planctomycetes bacterium]|nr:hydrogenase formation protein HypD [Planctomycetota bacterium]
MNATHVDRLTRDVAAAAAAVPGDGPIALMEICGTHTVAIRRSGLRSLLPRRVRLISGPGCPVCVTSQGTIDALIDLAGRPGVTVATFGDMVRVPGSRSSLEREKACGGRVAVCYSVLEALDLARRRPAETVVFAAVGFETTAPGTAVALEMARAEGLGNFTILAGHKWVIPAMDALLAGGEVRIDGFLCPGHVSVVIGSRAYEPVAARYRRPCVVAGFTAEQLLAGVAAILRQLAAGEARVENVYPEVVRPEGNPEALAHLARVFEPVAAAWRGLGTIPASGMGLRADFAGFDAAGRLGLAWPPSEALSDEHGCRCGDVIRGAIEPPECPLFGGACTPARPVGPCMVSREGSCQAEYKYGQA